MKHRVLKLQLIKKCYLRQAWVLPHHTWENTCMLWLQNPNCLTVEVRVTGLLNKTFTRVAEAEHNVPVTSLYRAVFLSHML